MRFTHLLGASLVALATPAFVVAQDVATEATQTANPLIGEWSTPDGVPPYDQISPEHYEPAFDAAIAEARAETKAIAETTAAPTFENVIEAMERAGQELGRVSRTFFTVASANATPEIQKIQSNVSPKLTRLSNETLQDQDLFARVRTVYDQSQQLGLTPEQLRLVEETHKNFVRAGAALDDDDRARVAEINERLSTLSVDFGQKLLADQQENVLFLTAEEVEGLPDDQKSAAAASATEAGKDGLYMFPATRSAAEPFLFAAPNRDAREKIWRAFMFRGDNDNQNNTAEIVDEIVKLRLERANLLGAPSHASFVLEETVAKTPEAATELLVQVFDAGLARAEEELEDISELAAADGIDTVEPWDWRYYAEQIRKERFALDEAELKQFMPLDGMVAAMFETTEKLFGLTMHERDDIPVYAPGVRVWEVREADGEKVGLYYADWFTRDTKRPGAWMNSIRTQNALTGDEPVVVNNQNLSRPAPGEPALISVNEAETLFHEFGHGLHGLLSDTDYPSFAGTNVSRDFVEFPAQLYEHWATQPKILRKHARNAAGEPMPEEMLQALLKARTFNQGFLTTQQLSSAILDMRIHSLETIPAGFDSRTWEEAQLDELGVPDAIGMRHRLPHFSHIFAGGYSAGY
ncbi:MAG: M3 family metallopeptidase, partial [Pseudomonadota bacterium]